MTQHPQSSPTHVLVVDDDYGIREVVAEFLFDEGYHVTGAADGRAALERLQAGEQPCVILLDLNMPVMTGWEFRDQQLQDPALASIPVIIISADRNLLVSPNLQAVDYFPKPIDFNRLIEVISQFCNGATG